MSKGEGKKIAIRFTDELVGDVSGMLPNPIGIGSEFYLPSGTATASSQYSSYAPERAFIDNTQYWYTRTISSWIQIELNEAVYISGFRWDTATTGYRPKDFKVQGSNDGKTWTDIYSGVSENESYWKEFSWQPLNKYKFYRWDISSGWSSWLYIYQIQLLAAGGQESSFTVTGQQYKYINGNLEDRDYKVLSVENHPIEENTILLNFGDLNTERFNDVEGNITIKYDAAKGNLSGRGGAVESFERSFLPTDLIQTPNPHEQENISVAPVEVVALLQDIEYPERYSEHGYITVAPIAVTVLLQDVGEINP